MLRVSGSPARSGSVGSHRAGTETRASGVARPQHAGKFGQIEQRLGDAPFFHAEHFSPIDAVFGPVFRCFDVFDKK